VEQRGNKLYHHIAGMANQPQGRLVRQHLRGAKKPGISRIPGFFTTSSVWSA
jgi:hypothetical protein